MNKEDWKLVGMILLFILYLVFGVLCAYATVIVTKEEGFCGFLTGATITSLLFIPVWYIGQNVIHIKDFFNDLFN